MIDKGLQPVYRLALADGKGITLTENHRVLTEGGWKVMRDAVGLVGSWRDCDRPGQCRLVVNGV